MTSITPQLRPTQDPRIDSLVAELKKLDDNKNDNWEQEEIIYSFANEILAGMNKRVEDIISERPAYTEFPMPGDKPNRIQIERTPIVVKNDDAFFTRDTIKFILWDRYKGNIPVQTIDAALTEAFPNGIESISLGFACDRFGEVRCQSVSNGTRIMIHGSEGREI